MDTLILRNSYSRLVTDSDEVRHRLWRGLRKRKLGYFHSRLYKQRKWDGFINFFDKDSGQFLTGLWPEVVLALHNCHRQFRVQDERGTQPFTVKSVDSQWLNDWLPEGMAPITLEDYQIDFINQAIRYQRGIIKAPTSAGKTFIMMGILKALPPGTPVLVCGNRRGVVRGAYNELYKWNCRDLGYFDGKTHEPNVITCASVMSAHHLGDLLPKFKVLIVDEVHMMMSPRAVKIYKKLTGCAVRIGLSATPFKFAEKDEVQKFMVKGYFGPLLKTTTTESGHLTTAELQERGRLSPSHCTFYYIREPHLPHDLYIDAVTNGIATNWDFLQKVARLARTRKGRTLILVERLTQGDTLNRLLPGSLWVQGKDDDETRDLVIEQLQKAQGDVVAIATTGIFSAAINVFVHNLINAAGGKAAHDVIQRMGRGLRTAQDKEILRYYDFIFKINPYLEDHSQQRIKILAGEGHEIEIKDEIDF